MLRIKQCLHDLYCTNWDSLKDDAQYNHPNISKLMDSKIVYCADKKYLEKLEKLRNTVKDKLAVPLTTQEQVQVQPYTIWRMQLQC